MSIKFLVLGGGILGLGGGGKCRFYFYGREDFSDLRSFTLFCAGLPVSAPDRM